jgi:hypothetical protein
MSSHFPTSSAHNAGVGRAFHSVTLLLLFTLCLATGCQKRPETSTTPTDRTNQPPDQAKQKDATQSQEGATVAGNNLDKNLDKGDLKFSYQPRKDPKGANASHKVGSDSQALKQVINDLNNQVALPWDIGVSFEDCNEPDAMYDNATRKITMCYQLIDEYYHLFSRKIKDKVKLDDDVRGALVMTFFHELGHGLVHAWQLPITGKEEDAVDQLSALVLLRTEKGEEMTIAGAVSFKLNADLDKGEQKIYWDEHSLDEQRYYDMICLVYGHNPEKYAYLVKDGTLPEERAELCRLDYPKVANAWQQLLSPYLKQSLTVEAGPGQARSGLFHGVRPTKGDRGPGPHSKWQLRLAGV